LHIVFSFAALIIILLLIVFACVLFTNAVEHLGEELNLSEGAVGSVLAAVGTALPETIVPLVAILGAYMTGGNIHTGNEIGIGAILGAPFMLGTLAFFVTGFAVFAFTWSGRRNLDMPVNTVIMFRDLHYFAGAYLLAILSSFIPFPGIKHLIALILIVIYGVYVFLTVRTASKISEGGQEELDALYFTRYIEVPGVWHFPAIILQLLVSLIVIILLAHFFVEQIKDISGIFMINPLILSMIIAPIATELPEKFNSVIWIRAKKDTLALGNITGAMVFQSCIPTAVGLALTPWVLGQEAIINVIIVYASVLLVYINIIKNKGVLKPTSLITGGLFYLIYLIYVFTRVING
jgi:cation:H+ antiporter